MGFKAADYCVTIVALEKENKKYGMSCAWMVQVDYDKIVCLLGSQSATGRVIKKGDRVGVSTLSKEQADLAMYFGSVSSVEHDKFNDVCYDNKNGAICIAGACRMMFCEVIEVLHLSEIEEDNLIYLRILDSIENSDDFLRYGEL